MKTLKLILLFLLVCGFAEARESPKKYRVIFNCDGHAVCKDAGGDLKQWIENLFGPLEKSNVDALFWCDGGGEHGELQKRRARTHRQADRQAASVG